MIQKIIEHLVSGMTPYQQITSFSRLPGIYALSFIGKRFPLDGYMLKKNEIIYIGKTERSQTSRDRDTHFKDGKTGSSTVRRSFGALLMENLKLCPIPRGISDIEKKRIHHYKFEVECERKLSQWMCFNLGLSFFEIDGYKSEIDYLESELISGLRPILNIDRKNPNNPYKSVIQSLRKKTGEIAYKDYLERLKSSISSKKVNVMNQHSLNLYNSGNFHKYEDIWEQLVPIINETISSDTSLKINIDKDTFTAVGNRKSYRFRLELNNAEVYNNIGGSAVARDLARVLAKDTKFMKLAKDRRLIFRLDNRFEFTLSLM